LGKQDKIWAKIYCITKNMHSRTPMCAEYFFHMFQFIFNLVHAAIQFNLTTPFRKFPVKLT